MAKTVKGPGGFTLIEIVIVLAIVAVLAGILSPTITRYVGSSRIRKAEADVRNLTAAMAMMYGDTGHWPIWAAGTATTAASTDFDILVSNDGALPVMAGGITGWDVSGDDFKDQLVDNAPSYPTSGRRAWRGPYLQKIIGDPWGSKYMSNVKFLQPANVGGTKPVFVISAGPNKLVDTAFEQAGPSMSAGGDDIVSRIK